MADSSQVAEAIAAAITSTKDYISACMLQVGPYTLNAILDYWKPAPDGNSYPLVMIQHIKEDWDWYSMPNNYITVFQFDIYGMVRGTEPEVIARTVEKMAGGIKDVLLQRNMSLNLQDGEVVVFIDEHGRGFCPVQSVTYIEMLSNQGQLSRGFRMRFKCSVITMAQDTYANVNKAIAPNTI